MYTNISVRGNSILYRGIDSGRRIQEKIDFSPSFFIPTKKESQYKTLSSQPVEKIDFFTIKDARNFIEKYKGIDNLHLYGQENFVSQFIHEKFKGELDWQLANIVIGIIDIETSRDEFGFFPDPHKGNAPITAISLYLSSKNKIFVFGYKPYQPKEDEVFIYCSDELDLCKRFLNFWINNYPDIISGFYSDGYDIPYLINRFNLILGETLTKKLSPWNNVWSRKRIVNYKEVIKYFITGIACLDFLELYKLYSPSEKNDNKLNSIALRELGEEKVSYEEYDDLDDLYKRNPQKYYEYNAQDVRLIILLEQKLKLIELAINVAYDAKVNFEDIFMQTRIWDSICYEYLKDRDIVIPFNVMSEDGSSYEGAYVKQPVPGKYHWLVTYDISSLYPSLIVQNNISPETVVTLDNLQGDKKYIDIICKYGIPHSFRESHFLNEELPSELLEACKELKLIITPSGNYFNNTKVGFVCEIVEKLFFDRQKYRKLMLQYKKEYEELDEADEEGRYKLASLVSQLNNKQLCKKISLNSLYGSFGTVYFRFYDLRLATSITLSGRLFIQWIGNRVNNYFNKLLQTEKVDYVPYGDTDSMFLHFDSFVKKVNLNGSNKEKVINYLNTICSGPINDYIKNSIKLLSDMMCISKYFITMNREKICDTGIFLAKKKYLLNVWDNEGVRYHSPKIAVTGLEVIRSSTPGYVRIKMRELLHILMNGSEEDTQNFIEKFRQEFYTLPVEDISFPRGVSGIIKYSDSNTIFKKRTPIHVRGSILYNDILEKYKLDKVYKKIQDGDKIKFVYLKLPNILQHNVIAFQDKLPKELELHEFVDYDTMFTKVFLNPIDDILTTVKWESEKRLNLLDFFGE